MFTSCFPQRAPSFPSPRSRSCEDGADVRRRDADRVVRRSFVLPDRADPPQPPMKGIPRGWSRILVHLDAKDEDVHARFQCGGSPQKSQEIFRLCRGNSRLMFAAAFSFAVSAQTVRAPCSWRPIRRLPPETAKTVAGCHRRCDPPAACPGSSLGFGSAWNGTPNGLEEYGPAHNDTLMVSLDETSHMPTDQKGRPVGVWRGAYAVDAGAGQETPSAVR